MQIISVLELVEDKDQENIIGLSREEIGDRFLSLGLQKFRSGQVWHWLYHKGATSFEEMTTLSKKVRVQLGKIFSIKRPTVSEKQTSADGTIKWLLQFEDGAKAETVFIPEEDRGTLCISSQVGCTLNCSFCHTGTQKLVRNLSSSELVGQILIAFDELSAWPSAQIGRPLTNIVLMGMGEPLYNLDNVIKALKIIMDNEGISISKRRITLSTSGIIPEFNRCGLETDVNLAISLHAVTDDVRDILVPINKRYPIKELLNACREYPGVSNSRRITFEYVMLKGVNDSTSDARALIKLMEGIPAKINLIPFNPWPGSPYECSEKKQIEEFAKIVLKAGYPSPVRTPRGDDILAACGQLKSASVRERNKKSRFNEGLQEVRLS
ncbi:MAG: 23S rRNA (adenine(2503)-C(2))-methyltransferase RlmN [Rhodospirillaceae bacterium]|nr:23S rRNA (adenine(2503)-C(2))-methyltransferase RlmN [Rhodospirillaceae bacterium]OUU13393.1 MAG: 23S rRNA (adenine(2503)-C(2))-methyltransferase [Candidatus Endolissoclinum sp. TMED37]